MGTLRRLDKLVFVNRKISIIGGTGKMGRWFAEFFRNQGFKVLINGRDAEKTMRTAEQLKVNFALTPEDAVKDAGIILIATPVETVPKIILNLASHMRKGSVLMDIASVKKNIVEALSGTRTFGVHSLSLHPMFGPGAKTIKGKNILLIPVTENKKIVAEMLSLFEKAGAKVTIVNVEEHDRMTAYTLALPHFLNLAFARTLASAGLNVNKIKSFGGTTFTLQLLIAESIVQEDPETYASIEVDNPAFSNVASEFLENVRLLKTAIDAKSRRDFSGYFGQAKRGLASDENFIEAYKKFYLAFDAVAGC